MSTFIQPLARADARMHHQERPCNTGGMAKPATSSRSLLLSSSVAPSREKQYGLTFSRGWLVKIAAETVKISQEGHYTNRQGRVVHVGDALREAKVNSVHYHSSHTFHPSETTQGIFEHTDYHVCYGSSLQVAKRLRDQLQMQLNVTNDDKALRNIGILNSASGKRPEKFLRGTLSQEEGICRASLLYACLLQYTNRPHYFYYVNHKPKYQETTSSCAIFSPRVPVIREDSMSGYLKDDFELYSFVSIPAPNAFALGGLATSHDDNDNSRVGGANQMDSSGEATGVIPKAQTPGSADRSEPFETMTIQSAMHDRIFRALSIFAEQGCTDLVLCAFGCGVHGNNPKEIASCFKDILSNELRGRFRTVVFAINPSRQHNYEQFVNVFCPERK